ncbi:MAG: IS6 family transposase [Francisellaceae bacterium]|nr:IS6 family transposase [Francisellaceae bacterium]
MISFKGKQFMKSIILMAVRWYVAYALSYRDIEELLLERGLKIDHSTINRWVIEYSPKLKSSFKNKKRPVGGSWRMDETYVKVKGKWMYQYRAVDKEGNTIDSCFSKKRSKIEATKFFIKAMNSCGKPIKINIDKSGANTAALNEINYYLSKSEKIEIRQNKYLNNMVEQDHRFIKKITRPTLGFKAFHSASATLDGIELHHMLRKGQHVNAANQTVFEHFYALAA